MADMPSQFWAGWIIVITVTSFIALIWLVRDVYRGGEEDDGTEDQVWDGTLREGVRPAPVWWFWFILALMSVSVVYVMLYPGLGAYKGVLRWSQGGRIAERFEDYDAQFGAERNRLQALPLAELANDSRAMQSAWRVFNNNCTSCHGRDAAGQALQFPDLTDQSWQWGGEEAQIVETIRSGRQAAMPAWEAVIGKPGVERVADYVLSLGAGGGGSPANAEGGVIFQQYCSACHGPTGSGQPLLGAPALDDAAWLYGGNRAQVIRTIAQGRNGLMPGFASRLDETQVRLLAAWLTSGARTPDER
ncbi:MAG: cytochrome-c oxidase, cbb3-type subunit III [Steroidobacteraceae bacterium]